MSGCSGKAVAAHTPLVKVGGRDCAVSEAQYKIIAQALREGGAVYVSGAGVRTARALGLFGTLRDDGAMTKSGVGNPDGERWYFELKEGVSI